MVTPFKKYKIVSFYRKYCYYLSQNKYSIIKACNW